MVPHLMRDHVGLGEISRGAMPYFQIVEKGQVDIELLVTRAVERTNGGSSHTTGGIDTAGEQHQGGPWPPGSGR